MPIVHVPDMGESVRFYDALGCEVVIGSRHGDRAQIRVGGTQIGLLANLASPGEDDVELAFSADDAFGEQLQLRDPDGRKVNINRIEPDLFR